MRALILSILLFSLPVFAADQAAVLPLLNGYGWRPDKAAFDQLGPDTYRVLIDIADNKSTTNLIRSRAMAALTLYSNDKVWTWFVSSVNAASDDLGGKVFRRRAVDALCKTFAAQRGSAVEAVVAPLLWASDVHLRVSAARCLRGIGGSKAEAALSMYRQHIDQPWEARAAGFSGGFKP